MSYGWLAPQPGIVKDASWFGVEMDPSVDTRWEEFTFVRDLLSPHAPGRLLDMGCGFEPGIHVMPEICAALGWQVEAIDNLDSYWHGARDHWIRNAEHPLISRRVLDMMHTDYPSETFDVVLSISVLEHVTPEQRIETLQEARRVLKPGGMLVVTMDAAWPSTNVPGFHFGFPFVPTEPLKNIEGAPVAFLVGTKV